MTTERTPERFDRTVTRTFHRPRLVGGQGFRWLVAGVVTAGFGCLGFLGVWAVAALVGGPGALRLHFAATLPVLFLLGALSAGWRMWRAPHRVEVGPDGLLLQGRGGVRHLRWDAVGAAVVETGVINNRRWLDITGRNGRSIAELDQSFGDFDAMVAAIFRFVAAKGGPDEQSLREDNAHLVGGVAGGFGALLLVIMVSVAWSTREQQRADRLLRTAGVRGEAEVVRRSIAPNGVTRWLEYRVTGSNGQAVTHNAQVDPAVWDRRKGVTKVPVVYVPDEPDITHLAVGEVFEADPARSPRVGYGIAALGGLMALGLIAFSPFAWCGYDLTVDAQTRRWLLKRHGELVWSSRGATPPPGLDATHRPGDEPNSR